jgi:hypothetical protein
MIDSPLIQKVQAEAQAKAQHGDILELLKYRFDKVPRDVAKAVGMIIETKRLRKFVILAAKCRDMDTFREALTS